MNYENVNNDKKPIKFLTTISSYGGWGGGWGGRGGGWLGGVGVGVGVGGGGGGGGFIHDPKHQKKNQLLLLEHSWISVV